ncbi:MAG TPA: hypothetical protein VGM12_10495 [Trebonia sp.]
MKVPGRNAAPSACTRPRPRRQAQPASPAAGPPTIAHSVQNEP